MFHLFHVCLAVFLLSGTECADPWILELAKKQRMNTDVRKNIFCILMTSEVGFGGVWVWHLGCVGVALGVWVWHVGVT